ncbi:putative FBD-associated F-box protein At5g56700 [Medicago truncatula]|uniref:putative FBD-associated F-box protein At5g56700 n=1 Tax=Medicago truncatula TaxID=3880 RepID=UPI000D2F3F65|nr:putative FBD-associated F-box protein At5g56700 [Medicago truncatula]
MPPSQSQSATTMVVSINNFPDEILTHILSFLPFKQAFKTSVLSKRWRPLCYSLPDLHITVIRRVHNFRRFMDAVMFSPHSHNLTLNSFYLTIISCSKFLETEADCFDKWVEAAKQRRVKDLQLHFLPSIHVPLAPTVFCCKTLVVLGLTGIHIGTLFHGSVDLPLLKTLTMFNIHLENIEDFMKLLSGCPILENLKTRYVKTTTNVTTGGNFKSLSKLNNADIRLFDLPFRAIYNVRFLRVHEMETNLANEEINLYYKGFSVFENLTDLQLSWCNGAHDWDEVVKMLQNCPKLQTLAIKKWIGSLKTTKDWKHPYHVPECVTSNLTTCEIEDYQAMEADFQFATYILQNARVLQVAVFRSFDSSIAANA